MALITLLSPSIFVAPPYSSSILLAEGAKVSSYYDTLELQPNASLQDIKKAYRRLAVLHHPDRNIGNEEKATILFRQISEAYEVLSDEELRRQYDQSLKRGGAGANRDSFGEGGGGAKWSYEHRRNHHRDPFAQFNDVFQNDPFFAEAFKSLDDLFDKHFASGQEEGERRSNRNKNVEKKNDDSGGGFLWNIAKNWLPNIEVTTTTSSTFGGRTTYSSTSRKYGSSSSSSSHGSRNRGSGGGGSGGSSSSSSYTSRSTRTIIQNGQRVTIQSLEKDGNKIEEKYVGDTLIERKINGKMQDIGRILSSSGGGGGEEF
jgi:curved DNA-binding protein CbpA